MNSRRLLALLVAASVLGALDGRAEVVVRLRSGVQLHAVRTWTDGDKVMVELPGGTASFPSADVAGIENDEAPRPTPSSHAAATAPARPSAPGHAAAAAPSNAANELVGPRHWIAPADPEHPIPFHESLNRVWFKNGTTGYVASGSAVLRTTDGGQTWSPVIDVRHDRKHGVGDIEFVDESTFFVRGLGGFFRSTDAGATLQPVSASAPAVDEEKQDTVRDFHFTDAEHGWALGNGQLLMTSDGGKTWQQRRLGRAVRQGGDPLGVWWFGADQGILYGGLTTFHTTDGGKSWVSSGHDIDVDRLSCTQAGSCVAIPGEQVTVAYLSTDFGATWRQTPTGIDRERDEVADLQAIGTHDAVLVGIHTNLSLADIQDTRSIPRAEYRGFMLRWDGTSWKRTDYEDVDTLRAVWFVDPDQGWAMVDANGLVHTTDGGRSWKLVPGLSQQEAASDR